MKQLLIHIGMQKTGTSSLQAFLHQNTEALARAGFVYPRWQDPEFPVVRGPSYHGHLAAYCADFQCSFARPSGRDVARFFAAIPDDDRTTIISAEAFSRLRAPERARALFESFRDIRIVLYLREQTRWMESIFNQMHKILFWRGDPIVFSSELISEANLFRFLRSQNYIWMLNLQNLVGGWERALGADRMTVRVYDPAEFAGGNLFSDFMLQLGVHTLEGFTVAGNVNQNLGNHVLRQLSLLAQSEGTEVALAEARRLAGDWRQGKVDLSGDYSILSASTKSRIIEQYRESNAMVARRYLDREVLFRRKD